MLNDLERFTRNVEEYTGTTTRKCLYGLRARVRANARIIALLAADNTELKRQIAKLDKRLRTAFPLEANKSVVP